MKEVRSERPFRERAFRGAKVEDVLVYLKTMIEKSENEIENAKSEQMRFFFEAQKHSYEAILARMKQDFQYDGVTI